MEFKDFVALLGEEFEFDTAGIEENTTFADIGFVSGDVRYTLLCFADYDADFMFQMAAELLAA